MLNLTRSIVILAAIIGTEGTALGAMMAAQVSGSEMETVQVILSYLGAWAVLMVITIWLFMRWFTKRHGNINPVDLLMLEKIKDDASLGPLLERLDKQDKAIARVVELYAREHAEDTGKMGSGEQHIRSLKP